MNYKINNIKENIATGLFIILFILFLVTLFKPEWFYSIQKLDYFYKYRDGNKRYESGKAFIDELITNQYIYWDADTNKYGNDISMDLMRNEFQRDLAFSYTAVGAIRTLSFNRTLVKKAVPYLHSFSQGSLALIKSRSFNCSSQNYDLMETPINVGDFICLKTNMNNFFKLTIISINNTMVEIEYEKENY
jgi:hypothetical protein